MSPQKAKIKNENMRSVIQELSAAGLYQGCHSKLRIVPISETSGYTIFLQIQHGCRFNKCLFCPFYKDLQFFEKSEELIREEIDVLIRTCADRNLSIRRVMLLDADGLDTGQDKLIRVIQYIREKFPRINVPNNQVMPFAHAFDCFYHGTSTSTQKPAEISSFSHTETILQKGKKGITELRDAGLGMIWWGIETGSANLLKLVNKSRNKSSSDRSIRQEILKAGNILSDSGVYYVAIILVGLGGEAYFDEHVEETSTLLGELQPPAVSYSDLVVVPGTPYETMVSGGKLDALSVERLSQQRRILENLDLMGPQFDYEVE